jgi:hypothetical protein
MPFFNRTIKPWRQGGVEFVPLCRTIQVMPPIPIAKSHQPSGFSIQRFGKITFSAFRINCTQEFSLMGRRVMISEPAAMMMATTAAVVGSMVMTCLIQL